MRALEPVIKPRLIAHMRRAPMASRPTIAHPRNRRRYGGCDPSDHRIKAKGQHRIDDHCDHSIAEGGPRVLAREIQRLQQFLQHEGGQPDAVDCHGQRCGGGILGAELAALEQNRHHRVSG